MILRVYIANVVALPQSGNLSQPNVNAINNISLNTPRWQRDLLYISF